MWFISKSLGDVMRLSRGYKVKRCVRAMGVWYVYV